ncbi:hypothetical protein Goarm_013352, partial [Gossypium armourianum]|nr:hypothetical protein [Gossypium armourianum]
MSKMNIASFYAPTFPGTCVCLNTDGVVQIDTGFSAVGGVIQDVIGKWVLGYNRFLGKSSAFVVELWGILN